MAYHKLHRGSEMESLPRQMPPPQQLTRMIPNNAARPIYLPLANRDRSECQSAILFIQLDGLHEKMQKVVVMNLHHLEKLFK